jgi:RNA polymerase sigma factor (sigma-70 family)
VQELSVVDILNGIKEKNSSVLDFVYDNYFYQIKVFITQNNGTDEDAQDVYQDAIIIIYQKLQKEKFSIYCSFSTYLYSVCRLLWLKQLEHRKLRKLYLEESEKFIEIDESYIRFYEINEKYKLYQDHFKRLSYNCQKIMELFLAGIPLKEISHIMGFKGDQYVKKRKHICKEKLVESIKKDPRFESLKKQYDKTLYKNNNLLINQKNGKF